MKSTTRGFRNLQDVFKALADPWDQSKRIQKANIFSLESHTASATKPHVGRSILGLAVTQGGQNVFLTPQAPKGQFDDFFSFELVQ